MLFDYNDFELEKDGAINDIGDSNLAVQVFNHPFGFKIYRKESKEVLFDTTHSFESENFNHYLYLARNYMQISSRLSNNHFTYGLVKITSNYREKDSQIYV